ncbi:hypothetical protein DP56_5914 [Burkholderia pseudomallei]|nr:hypothetical protein DP56_5914 [Burkholderia pseudomallei]
MQAAADRADAPRRDDVLNDRPVDRARRVKEKERYRHQRDRALRRAHRARDRDADPRAEQAPDEHDPARQHRVAGELVDSVRDHAAARETDRADEPRHDRRDAHLADVQVMRLHEIARKPAQEEEQHVVVAEERDARRQYARLLQVIAQRRHVGGLGGMGGIGGAAAAGARARRRRSARRRGGGARAAGRHRRRLRRGPVRRRRDPHEHPREADRAHDPERRPPAELRGEHPDDRPGERAAERRAGAQQPHRRGRRFARQPVVDHLVRGRAERPLGHAEQQAHDQQADEADRDRRHPAEDRPEAHGDHIDALRPEPVRRETADEVEQRIADEERAEDDAHLRGVDPEIPPHHRRDDRQRDAVEIIDAVHDEQQEYRDPPHRSLMHACLLHADVSGVHVLGRRRSRTRRGSNVIRLARRIAGGAAAGPRVIARSRFAALSASRAAPASARLPSRADPSRPNRRARKHGRKHGRTLARRRRVQAPANAGILGRPARSSVEQRPQQRVGAARAHRLQVRADARRQRLGPSRRIARRDQPERRAHRIGRARRAVQTCRQRLRARILEHERPAALVARDFDVMQPHRERALEKRPLDARRRALGQRRQPAQRHLLRAVRRDLRGAVRERRVAKTLDQRRAIRAHVVAGRHVERREQLARHHAARERVDQRIGHRVGHRAPPTQLAGIGDRRVRAVQQAQLHLLVRPHVGRDERARVLPARPCAREAVLEHPLRERLADDRRLVAHADTRLHPVERFGRRGGHDPVDHRVRKRDVAPNPPRERAVGLLRVLREQRAQRVAVRRHVVATENR